MNKLVIAFLFVLAILIGVGTRTARSTDLSDSSKRAAAVRDWADSQNVPILLTAKVIDQHGRPVSGAAVELSVRHWLVVPSEPFDPKGAALRFKRESDAQGLFTLTNVNGDSLTLKAITKDGYILEPETVRGFRPPELLQDNPKLFRMWRKVASEETLEKRRFWQRVIPDGRIYTFDLPNAVATEGKEVPGDFRISVSRPAEVGLRDPYDWTYTITSVNGGLTQCEGPFHYEAPAAGYSSNYTETFPKSLGKGWPSTAKQHFFLKSRNGANFSHLRLEIMASYQESAAINIGWILNTNGSRNLQPKLP